MKIGMKNLVKINFVLAAFFMCLNVSAQDEQISFGVKGGVNLSNFGGDVEDLDSKIGFNVGLTLDYNIMENFYLLTGLELTSKGAKESYEGNKATINAMYLQLPVHAAYKFDLSDGMKIVVNAGPYLAYGIGGKVKEKYEGDSESYDFFGDAKEGYAKRFDFGIGVGLGLEFGSAKLGVGYDLGMANLYDSDDYKVNTNNLFVTVGYKF